MALLRASIASFLATFRVFNLTPSGTTGEFAYCTIENSHIGRGKVRIPNDVQLENWEMEHIYVEHTK